MSGASFAVALTLVAALAVGCGDQDDPSDEPSADPQWSTPQDGFCDDVVAEAGLDAEVEERVSGDDDDTSATCVLLTDTTRVDLVVRVAEQAGDQYEHTLSEREGGFVGFRDPEVSEPEGWWTEGTRFEAVEMDSVRLADLLLADNLVVQLQLVETPASGDPAERQSQARDAADALDAAVGAVLER